MRPEGWEVVMGQLTALREWRSVYRRWWTHPARADGDARDTEDRKGTEDATAPWTDADQARLDRLTDTDPGQLAAAADRLAGEAVTLGHLAGAVFEAGETAGASMTAAVDAVVTECCGSVASAVRARAADLSSLAHDLRRAAEHLESWMVELVSLARRSDARGAVAACRSPGSAHREIDDADRWTPAHDTFAGPAEAPRWPALDDLVDRHGGLIRSLRRAMDAVDAVDLPGVGWCGDRGPGAGGPCAAAIWEGGWPPPPAPGVSDSVAADQVPVGGFVLDRAERDRVLGVWRPLPLAPRGPGLADPAAVEPGVGPLLPDTGAERIGTDTGVRIAQLPDNPSTESPPRR